MSNTITHWINNKPYPGASGATAAVTNPATGAVTGEVALASVADARAVIDAAAAAFPAWRDTSLAKRSAILFKVRELLNARKPELAKIITAEHGKVVSDALGEVSRGQEVVEFACGVPHLLKGGFTENASTKVDVYSVRQPLGPVGIISPFNFPAMVPMWFFPIAIAAGNTVVLKPSEKDPSASLWIAELWAEAGLPPGVFNLLQGDKTAGSTPTPMATAPPSSPTTAAPRGASKTKSKSAWSASTCPSPCRWPTTASAAGKTRCSATATPTARKACTSSPAAKP
jgi:malonate-semialdehyde dehydrogenase (acetylating) / methylmalonate-semialdehyde dehydrogenase